MRTLRRLFSNPNPKRSADVADLRSWGEWVWPRALRRAIESSDPADIDQTGNDLSVLGAGVVGHIDAGGTIALSDRPASIEVWVGGGDRWWFPAIEGSVRQRRVDGLPIVETRMRVGDADVVMTAWADEPGDGRGRIVVSCATETEVPVVLAVVVRPFTRTGPGSIEEMRSVDNLLVANGRPIVVLPREPGDVLVGSSENGDCARQLGDRLVGDTHVAAADGSATLAAMLPLTPGADLQFEIVDGREEATVSPAPLDAVVAGWKSHLELAANVELPGWPKHLLPSLLSGMIGSGHDQGVAARTHIAAALIAMGLDRPAATLLESVLDDVALGSVDRSDWPSIALAVGRHFALGSELTPALEAHGDTVGYVTGEALRSCGPLQRTELAAAIRALGNPRAAEDVESASLSPSASGARTSARLGVDIEDDAWAHVDSDLDATSVASITTAMVSTSRTGRAVDGLVALRALAGSTWRWGIGDDPTERARIALAMRSLVVRETSTGIDVVPGISTAWFGQNVTVERVPTRHGLISFALRWHGPRPALLWEVEASSASPVELTCRSLDPSWQTMEASGEALLEAPNTGSH
ncbi:MAG: hypothetical protein HKN94_02595 [Acidimicrobiales bacterium]|nr:hypothetical protein [Acidimicrobiales bacterium]RZV47193.1 MAG: hypothetical protein EX269_05440 [Acidimicrobiales bacterium]